MKAKVSRLRRKGRKIEKPEVVEGNVNVSNEIAFVCNDSGAYLLPVLSFCRLKQISADGLFLTGVEDRLKNGSQLDYQEWFVRPLVSK